MKFKSKKEFFKTHKLDDCIIFLKFVSFKLYIRLKNNFFAIFGVKIRKKLHIIVGFNFHVLYYNINIIYIFYFNSERTLKYYSKNFI